MIPQCKMLCRKRNVDFLDYFVVCMCFCFYFSLRAPWIAQAMFVGHEFVYFLCCNIRFMSAVRKESSSVTDFLNTLQDCMMLAR